MYRVELKGPMGIGESFSISSFLMYRVELKVKRKVKHWVIEALLFLMYRVELKGSVQRRVFDYVYSS